MIDLWQLLVVNLFQGFWAAVIGLTLFFYLIMVIGKISQVTALNFLSIFCLSMALGYGYSLISILLTIIILTIHLYAIPKLVDA